MEFFGGNWVLIKFYIHVPTIIYSISEPPGAGKTYTMLGTDDDPGIMARALNDLFLKMEESSGEMTYEVSMSYLEVRWPLEY